MHAQLMRLALTVAALQCISLISAVDIPPNAYPFCIRYYGSVSSEIELPDTLPKFNYNGSIPCPTSMRLPTRSGATLTLCPPLDSYNDEDPIAMSAELRLSDSSGVLADPIDNLHLAPRLITNGSVTGPFENSGQPAIIAHNPARESSSFLPVWTINGTEAALTDSPDDDDRTNGVYFGCRYNDSPYYCGGFEDLHATSGGCWSSQWMLFNMRNALNFTIRFSDSEASVEIWAASPVDEEQSGMTTTYVSFGGNRKVPSVVDYDFWTNTLSDYEIETAYASERQSLKLEMGQDELPVFVNRTDSEDAYAVGNGTFSSATSALVLRDGAGWPLVLITVLALSAYVTLG